MSKPFVYLIGCECSGSTFNALWNKYRFNPNVEVFSCDLKPCESSHLCPERHFTDDLLKVIEDLRRSGKSVDCLIAHPPCTYLTRAGAQLMFPNGVLNPERFALMREAVDFFRKILNSEIPHVCCENPTPMHITELPPYDEVVEPYWFGDPFTKRTCLWLKNLPELEATSPVYPYKGSYVFTCSGSTNRSRSFKGFSDAIAAQWTPERISDYFDFNLF